jgi:hypothetical protein
MFQFQNSISELQLKISNAMCIAAFKLHSIGGATNHLIPVIRLQIGMYDISCIKFLEALAVL